MSMRRILPLTAICFACNAAMPATELEAPKPTIPDPPIETTVQTLADCTPVELWRKPVQTYGWLPTVSQFSPNGGLVTRGDALYFGGTHYFRLTNGDLVASVEQDFTTRDKRWERGARWGYEGVEVETLFEGSVVFHKEYEEGLAGAALSLDGDRLAVLMCRENSASLDVYTLPQGVKQTIELPELCENMWMEAGRRIIPIDDTRVLVATKTRIHRIDLASGAIESSRKLSSLPEDSWGIAGVVSFTIDAKTGDLGVVTGDPRLVVLDTETLMEKSETEVPLLQLNRNIYAPMVYTSPVAWSPDGRLFARLDMNNDLVLEKTSTREIHARIAPVPAQAPWMEELIEPAASVTFSPDGKLLAVAFEHEFALWGCAPLETVERPKIAVRLEGPTEMKLGEKAFFLATDLEGLAFHGHQFTVDGVESGIASEKRQLEWTAETLGEHTITVRIDDGLRAGEASLEVFVRE